MDYKRQTCKKKSQNDCDSVELNEKFSSLNRIGFVFTGPLNKLTVREKVRLLGKIRPSNVQHASVGRKEQQIDTVKAMERLKRHLQ